MIYLEKYIIRIVRQNGAITVEQSGGRENLTDWLSLRNAILQDVRFDKKPVLSMEQENRIKGDSNAY